jgi:hypothetical protein
MIFTTFLACLSFSLLAAASTLPSNSSTSLQPWRINDVYTYSPSGSPGNPPYSTFTANITNPNAIPLPATRWGVVSFPPTTAICSTKWIQIFGSNNESPFDRVIQCEAAGFGEGKWMMEIKRANRTGHGPSSSTDFTLQFTMEESMVLDEGAIRLKYVGSLGFSTKENLVYVCAGSGFCKSWLDKDKGPQLVVPVVEVECLYGVCDSYKF